MKSGAHFLRQYCDVWMNLWYNNIADYYHLNGFVSDSVSRNTFGIEKAYYFELRKCTLSSDVVTYEVTPT